MTCNANLSRKKYASNPEKYRSMANASRSADPEKYSAYQRAHYAANQEKRLLQSRENYFQKRDEIAAKRKSSRLENYEKVLVKEHNLREKNRHQTRARRRVKYAEDPAKYKADSRIRRIAFLNSVPSWFGEFDRFVWLEAADLVEKRTASTGVKWAADHLIPIRSKIACGLHAWNNCQVITAKMNNTKNNRFILTEPLEWIKHI